MITITGLSTTQVELLDTMWAIDSAEDYDEWKSGLSESTMNMVDTLEQMVMLAELDEIEDSECDKAMALLSKYMA
jgi:hypothetical protein